MQLRYFIYAVLFLVLSFILNIVFYFFSSDYREFLQHIKEDDIEKNEMIINDNINKNKQQKKDLKNIETKNTNTTNIENISYVNDAEYKDNISTNSFQKELKVEYKINIEKVRETRIEKEFLNKFKEYKLKKLELHPRLFDLTTEYPSEYIEYYSEYLTLYFFGNKTYDELKDIFQVLTYELPFTLNEVNNFGDKSFYINLNQEFQDGQVRIVLSYKNRTFGLKVSKDLYPLVKEKLKRLK